MNDPAGTAGSEVGYEVIADETWAAQALDLYQRRQLQVQAFNTDGVVSAQVWGTCPRCTHSLDVQMTLSAPLITRGEDGRASAGKARKFLIRSTSAAAAGLPITARPRTSPAAA